MPKKIGGMAFSSIFRSLSLHVLLVLASIHSSESASIAAWWTTIGPQVIVQNSTTGFIQYSLCNSNKTPIYPYDQGNVFSLTYKPKNGTSLSGVGWWNDKTTTASIFYQDAQSRIINALFECDFSTGKFNSQGSWAISNDAPSVHNNTGLASLVLGSTAGYRVYYHDANMTIHEIGYTTKTNWQYNGLISPDRQASNAIHAAFSGTTNISVVTPRDSENVEVTRFYLDDSWHITTFPRSLAGNVTTNNSNSTSLFLNTTTPTNFSLPAFGTPRGIGVTIDSGYTRAVWYIGSDRTLYSAANIKFVWSLQTNQSNLFWPQADEPNAPIGVTSDFSSSNIRIYYFVEGFLTEVKYDTDGVWKQATALPTYNATAPTVSSPNSTATAAAETSSATSATASMGLSAGAKAGIGVGVTLGVLAFAGVVGALFFFRRREARRQDAAAAAAAEGEKGPSEGSYDPNAPDVLHDYASQPPYGSPPPQTPGHEGYFWDGKDNPALLESHERPQELEQPRPLYEMADQAYSHELVGESHVREMHA